MADRNHLERLHDELADSGKLIESGWVGMRLACEDLARMDLIDKELKTFISDFAAKHIPTRGTA